jgi:hypothetical protein
MNLRGIDAIHQETIVQNWKNEQNFNAIIERFEY